MDENAVKQAMQWATPDEKRRLTAMIEELKRRELREKAQNDFMSFVRFIWGDFVDGAHHKRMANIFESVASGERKRVIINLAPRHTKSEFASYLLPAWLLGKYPKKKIMQISNTSELAEGFGRKVRNLVGSEEYREIFPDVELRQDSKAAGRWNTNHGGEYYATGVGGALAGRGADYCVALTSIVYEQNKGATQAQYIELGDKLLGSDGYGVVTHIINSVHSATVNVDGAELSKMHPVWTANRGWVDAGLLTTQDYLQSVTWYDRLYSLLTNGGYRETSNKRTKKLCKSIFKNLQYMVRYAATLLKPKCSQLYSLWSQRYKSLQSLVKIRSVYCRYGRTANSTAHAGQDRPERRLYTGELSLGRYGNSVQQQTQQREYNSVWEDSNGSAMGAGDRAFEGYDKAQNLRNEFSAGRSVEYAEGKLGTKTSITVRLAGKLCPTLRITRSYGEGYRIEQKSDTSVLSRKEQIVLWVLLGIRKPKSVVTKYHNPEQFINFTVQGHNTFIVNPYLTHNCIVDDPHTEAEALAAQTNPAVYDKVYEWYTSGPRQRLQPGGALIIVMTRWSLRDLTGQIIKSAAKNNSTDIWDVIEFPAIMPSGKPLWPEYWSLEALDAVKAEIPNAKWQAQYQQNPTSEEGALIKREWWREWERDDPPKNIDYVLMSWDTAFEKHNKADYSALTVWGVFQYDGDDGEKRPNIIVLDAVKRRVEFPELKQWAIEAYREWNPDGVIIEKRASGAPLIYELRRMGIPVQEYTPTKGNDKISRINSIADIFASGFVWAPQTRWADELIDDVASFPSGEHDDLVDTVSQAMLRFRQGGFVRTSSDEEYEEQNYSRRRRPYY